MLPVVLGIGVVIGLGAWLSSEESVKTAKRDCNKTAGKKVKDMEEDNESIPVDKYHKRAQETFRRARNMS